MSGDLVALEPVRVINNGGTYQIVNYLCNLVREMSTNATANSPQMGDTSFNIFQKEIEATKAAIETFRAESLMESYEQTLSDPYPAPVLMKQAAYPNTSMYMAYRKIYNATNQFMRGNTCSSAYGKHTAALDRLDAALDRLLADLTLIKDNEEPEFPQSTPTKEIPQPINTGSLREEPSGG